jgi:F subunit of K+-transporting ATPase (Potass_KdpF)
MQIGIYVVAAAVIVAFAYLAYALMFPEKF